MGYMDKNGLVGKYKGKDVYIVDYNDLEPEWKHDKDTIYAVRTNRHNYLDLVLDGILIGQMSDGGGITSFSVNTGYPWPKSKVEYKSEPAIEPKPDVLALDVSDGYAQYSRVVDNFFKGLDKLWQELEVG